MERNEKGHFIKGHKGFTFWKGKKLSSSTKKKISQKLKGRPLSKETKNKMIGRIPWNKGKKGLVIMSIETRLAMSKRHANKKHWNWQGGISDKNEKARKSIYYELWRNKVFSRDDYKCVMCGIKGGWNKDLRKRIKLEADHIKPFAKYHELRYEVNNGRTLCCDCHKKTDTWGNGTRFAKIA